MGVKRSKILIPLHLVWATKHREPWITPEIERQVHRVLVAEATKHKAVVTAINSMPDHVHLAVMFPATISVADFMKQLKGTSSMLLKAELCQGQRYHWQEGYGAFAFQMGMMSRVVAYIKNQKTHHTDATTWPSLEATNEDTPPPGGRSARSASSEEFSTPRTNIQA
jgi:REP element-mobilizing transposase RayT